MTPIAAGELLTTDCSDGTDVYPRINTNGHEQEILFVFIREDSWIPEPGEPQRRKGRKERKEIQSNSYLDSFAFFATFAPLRFEDLVKKTRSYRIVIQVRSRAGITPQFEVSHDLFCDEEDGHR